MERHKFRIDGNLGAVLFVYEDRCELLKQSGEMRVFRFCELEKIEFRNLTFFLCGHIKFCPKRTNKNYRSQEENWFFFTAFNTEQSQSLIRLMPKVRRYINLKIRENGA